MSDFVELTAAQVRSISWFMQSYNIKKASIEQVGYKPTKTFAHFVSKTGELCFQVAKDGKLKEVKSR
jgi:hypothetical protein